MSIPFIQARHFTISDYKQRQPRVIVMHSMEAPEKGTTAEDCAHYFATTDRKASAHYCVDNNSIVQCVQCKDVAYGAPGVNRVGLHIELAGFASQTQEQWRDTYSTDMLETAARLVRELLVPKFHIEKRWLGVNELRAIAIGESEKTGLTTHRTCTEAMRIVGGHTDPGLNFPSAGFIRMVLRT